MRYIGLVLGGLFLADGLLSLVRKQPLLRVVSESAGDNIPRRAQRSIEKATDMNGHAMMAQGINNTIAGAGMLLLATFAFFGHRHHMRTTS
jgi:hypothetical protein